MGDPNTRDPGIQYLYDTAPVQQPKRPATQLSREPSLSMAPLPRPVEPGSRDWGPSLGNLESTKLALDTLRGLIMDAVFLDEDAYTNAATLQLYQQRIQAQQRRILQLESELEAMRVEAERQQEAFTAQKAKTRAAEGKSKDLQLELDNNAVVFSMHYNELLLKNEEIERLKAVIEGMGSNG